MKRFINKIALLGSVFVILSCSDFEEINIDPLAANTDQVQVEYFINKSIGDAQQDPHISERVFVLYWKDAARMDRIGTLSEGFVSDGWTNDYFQSYVSRWLNDINTAIKVADEKIAANNIKEYTANLKQIARIWRVYIMSEMADNFGPMPVNGFNGENPEYNSVKDIYYYMLKELDEAAAEIDLSIETAPDAALDPAYGYDYEMWKKYANSLRMRLAMRLSEVDPAKAKAEFEDAVSGGVYIAEGADNFKVKEDAGWNSFTGVMTRQWNNHYISATYRNLTLGLGGVKSEDLLPAEKHASIKPENYLGLRLEDHFTTLTNDPSAGYWLDGLPNVVDPRAYKTFPIPGDVDNQDFNKYPTWSSAWSDTDRDLLDDDGNTVKTIEAENTWNAMTIGEWGDKGAKNQLSHIGTLPRLADQYRTGTSDRIFFASWETYFLIAEAAVRGWTVPMAGKAAYEKGIEESFAYFGVSEHLSDYLTSNSYNRAGTSVSWDHTAEPPASVTMDYVNGYDDTPGTVAFTYPENTIYEGGAVKNDYLNKIITQKYLAQTPWLPLEVWSDHRRLGLPFFENPAVENPLANLQELNASNVMKNKVGFFGQRLKYPSSFQNNIPEGYSQAVELLGGPDEVHTPLWWAKQD